MSSEQARPTSLAPLDDAAASTDALSLSIDAAKTMLAAIQTSLDAARNLRRSELAGHAASPGGPGAPGQPPLPSAVPSAKRRASTQSADGEVVGEDGRRNTSSPDEAVMPVGASSRSASLAYTCDLIVYSCSGDEKAVYEEANGRLQAAETDGCALAVAFVPARLTAETARLALGAPAVAAGPNDDLSAPVMRVLADCGVRLVVARSPGRIQTISMSEANAHQIAVCAAADSFPSAAADHALALIMSLNRKTYRAYARSREGNFSLVGQLGFDMHGKTCGVVGFGDTGAAVARRLLAFGCTVLGVDPSEHAVMRMRLMGVKPVTLGELISSSDVISLHCPLTNQTHNLIDAARIAAMKPGVMLINIDSAGLIDIDALLDGLKARRVGYCGLDVYGGRSDAFFVDVSSGAGLSSAQHDQLARLMSFPNVIVTPRQSCFTVESVRRAAAATLEIARDFLRAGSSGAAAKARMTTGPAWAAIKKSGMGFARAVGFMERLAHPPTHRTQSAPAGPEEPRPSLAA